MTAVREAGMINITREAGECWAVIKTRHGDMRISTAGMRIRLTSEDGEDALELSVTRDDFTRLLVCAAGVKCDG